MCKISKILTRKIGCLKTIDLLHIFGSDLKLEQDMFSYSTLINVYFVSSFSTLNMDWLVYFTTSKVYGVSNNKNRWIRWFEKFYKV